MQIALYVGLFLCAFLFLLGLLVWWFEAAIFVRLCLSVLCIAPAVAFGAMFIEEL